MLQLFVIAGVLFGSSLQPVEASVSHAELIARVARNYLGEHYVYGDIGLHGYDCSSFVQTVFRQNGYVLPRTSREQVMVGEPIALDEVRPGDLLFFTTNPGGSRITHVGIALPHNRMIHASRGHMSVVISKWNQTYYRNRWFAARRLRAGDIP